MSLQGRILHAYNRYYDVETSQGIVQARSRGKLKSTIPLTGDFVEISLTNPEQALIEKILPRKNYLSKPPVANIDQAFILFCHKQPHIQIEQVQRYLLYFEAHQIPAQLILNKTDLLNEQEQLEIRQMQQDFKKIGYLLHLTCLTISAEHASLKKLIASGEYLLAGPSGVGKSTLTNLLIPEAQQKVQPISTKIGRGKQTTRFSRLLSNGSGLFLVDSPGFSMVELNSIRPEALMGLFPEMQSLETCQFNDCLHDSEPGCKVKSAVEQGFLLEWRYNFYLKILQELRQSNKNRYQ